MTKYIRIIRYNSCNILEEVQEVINSNLMDEDTRLFFNKNECITSGDVAVLSRYFDIVIDGDFDMDNVVFKPNRRMLKAVKNDRNVFA